MRLRAAGLGAALAAILLAGCSASRPDPAPSGEASEEDETRQPLALFTSLPIFWAEGDVGDLLSGDAPQHWARAALEERYRLTPVDSLTDLPAGGLLLMAQPRALSGEENVALDSWVRDGGRVLLLVDPMLHSHSAYGLGDRRRPEAMTMLSPILSRWGLALDYDEDQADDWQVLEESRMAIPVATAGTLRLTGKGHESRCSTMADAVLAVCWMGTGKALVMADAELLADGDHPHAAAHQALLDLLEAAAAPPPPTR